MPAIQCKIVEVGIFSFDESHPLYLLLKRSGDDALYPHTWQIVTGAIEEGETALVASLRELQEETGFVPQKYWVVPHMNTFLDPIKDVVHMTAVFLAQVPPRSVPLLSSEHSEFQWCSLQRTKEQLVWPGQIQAIEIIDQYIVRGLQAGPLTELPLGKH
jgi:dihydroneopterin triphosphate diphosphatase